MEARQAAAPAGRGAVIGGARSDLVNQSAPIRSGTICPGRFFVSAFVSCWPPVCSTARPGLRIRAPLVKRRRKRRPFAKPGTPRQEERIRYVDVKHVKAELTLATKQKEVRGTVTHTLSPLHPYLTRVELDCAPELKVTQGDQVGQRRKRRPVQVHDRRRQAHGHARQSPWPRRNPRPGDRVHRLARQKGCSSSSSDPAYPERPLAIWTQGESEDTHYWLPCYDYPNDRATSEMIITVENPLFVVSNGALLETRKNAGDTTTYHWKMDVPHSSYLISLAVGDFTVYHDKVGDLPVDYYVAKGVDEATARRFMGKTPADDPFLRRIDRPAVSLRQVRPDLPPRVRRRDGEHLGDVDDR